MEKIRKNVFFVTIFISSMIACNNSKSPISFIKKIETAHQKDTFISKDAIQFYINLQFGGKERLNGKITLTTNSSEGLIELANGHKIYYKDDIVYHSPDIPNEQKVRFDAYT